MEYWFRKAPNRYGSERYAPTSWKGYALVVAAVVVGFSVPALSPGIPPVLRSIVAVPWLLVVLAALFAIVRRRVEPPEDGTPQP